MGRGTTALIGWFVGVLLMLLRSKGLLRALELAFAIFLPLDLISYSLFPLIGLRHTIITGGKNPEPYLAALDLGISPPWLIECRHSCQWALLSRLVGHHAQEKNSTIPKP